MRKGVMALILMCVFCLSFSAFTQAEELSGSIQIKASDTMVNLGQAWAEEFNKLNPKVNIAVTGGVQAPV